MFLKKIFNKKRPLVIVGGVILFCLVAAVIIGILSALIGNGEWEIGWSSYRYDETGYEIGSGSVASKKITAIEINWIDGNVEIVVCDDAFLSVTESCEDGLSEATTMRRKLSLDGTSLSVKYRKSAAFVGFGNSSNGKQLTVRIPRYMLTQLNTLQINSSRANIALSGVGAKEIGIVTKRGSVEIDGAMFDALTVETEKGNATVCFDESDGFLLELDANKNRFVCDRTLEETEFGYCYGNGRAKIVVSAPYGKVEFKAKAVE